MIFTSLPFSPTFQKTEELKQLIKSMWNDLDPNTRREYEKMEADDVQRYERELAAWTASNKKRKAE